MKKVLLIVLILILFVCTGVGSFFLGTHVTSKDRCVDVKDEVNEEEKKDNTDKEQNNNETLYVNMEVINDALYRYSSLVLVTRGFDNINTVNVNDLMLFAVYDYDSDLDNEFTLDDLNKVLKKYFDYELSEGQNIMCDVCENILYNYDKETKTFKHVEDDSLHGHEGNGLGSIRRIISVEVDDDGKYVVQTKEAFGSSPYVITEYYDDLEEDSELVFELTTDPEFVEAEFNKVPNDKLKTFEYVFEVIDNTLVLKSYKRI